VVLCAAIIPDAESPNRASVTSAPPRFIEETSGAGIPHTYDGGFEHAVGGGVAAFDCSGDGKPDLYLAGGSGPAALYRNESPIGGAFRFARVRDPSTDLAGVNGAYPIDIDGDGITDLAILRNGGNVLLRGLGGCRFERANEQVGVLHLPRLVGLIEARTIRNNRQQIVFNALRHLRTPEDILLALLRASVAQLFSGKSQQSIQAAYQTRRPLRLCSGQVVSADREVCLSP